MPFCFGLNVLTGGQKWSYVCGSHKCYQRCHNSLLLIEWLMFVDCGEMFYHYFMTKSHFRTIYQLLQALRSMRLIVTHLCDNVDFCECWHTRRKAGCSQHGWLSSVFICQIQNQQHLWQSCFWLHMATLAGKLEGSVKLYSTDTNHLLKPFWYWHWNIPEKLGRYHCCCCPGSLHGQVVSSNDMDHVWFELLISSKGHL